MEDERIVILFFLSLLGFCVVVTNTFVLYLVYKKESLRTATNICLASLAMSDLMSGAIGIPLVIACNQTLDFKGTCFALDMISRFISISTALHLLVVTVERYIMIVHAMRYISWVTTGRVTRVLLATWSTSAAVTLVQLTWRLPNQDDEEAYRQEDVIYGFTCFAGIVIVPLVIIAISYLRIFVALRYQLEAIQRLSSLAEKSHNLRRRRIERKAAIIFGGMIIMFVLCWFSYFLDGIREDLGSEEFNYPHQVQILLMFLRYVSPLINPLLYTFLKEDFKNAVRSMIHRRGRWNSSSDGYLTQATSSKSATRV